MGRRQLVKYLKARREQLEEYLDGEVCELENLKQVEHGAPKSLEAIIPAIQGRVQDLLDAPDAKLPEVHFYDNRFPLALSLRYLRSRLPLLALGGGCIAFGTRSLLAGGITASSMAALSLVLDQYLASRSGGFMHPTSTGLVAVRRKWDKSATYLAIAHETAHSLHYQSLPMHRKVPFASRHIAEGIAVTCEVEVGKTVFPNKIILKRKAIQSGLEHAVRAYLRLWPEATKRDLSRYLSGRDDRYDYGYAAVQLLRREYPDALAELARGRNLL